jgi:hypothetical protein
MMPIAFLLVIDELPGTAIGIVGWPASIHTVVRGSIEPDVIKDDETARGPANIVFAASC